MAEVVNIAEAVERAKSDSEHWAEFLKRPASATHDSFQNFLANVGHGTDNIASGATYGFNPITRIRNLLEWIHRGSWLGGVAVDVVADDMTSAGIDYGNTLDREIAEDLHNMWVDLNIWGALNEAVKWGRLYGGAVGVYLIDGQDFSKPLQLDRIGKNQFRGILVLDRWMVEPSLNDLVTDLGPDLGMPKFYRVVTDAPALPRATIHYSRIFRTEGVRLPYWQRLQENLWSISVYERLYDRMVAFDSATQGAAQLVYKSYLRTFKVEGLRKLIAAGGEAQQVIERYVGMMARFQSIEGITLIDGNDEFAAHTHTAFAGLSDALMQFGQQLSGALQIPLVRLFGQSPAGLNSTGESDLQTYEDGINTKQEQELRVPVHKCLLMSAASQSIKLPDRFTHSFNPIRHLTLQKKYEAAKTAGDMIAQQFQAGIIRRETALRSLQKIGAQTGVIDIGHDEIDDAVEEPSPGELDELEANAPEPEPLALPAPEPEPRKVQVHVADRWPRPRRRR